MKLRQMIPKRKLRATATRRAARPRLIEEEEEPTMKLSSAFIVVVLLHLVAVGGIYTFESIKVHHPAAFEPAKEEPANLTKASENVSAVVKQAATAAAATAAPAPAVAKVTEPAASRPSEAARHPAIPKDSGKIHTVTHGENPVTIARRFGVSSADLLKLNGISDPTKLQIGAKLHIPVKTKTAND